jgi:hypothetical protein
VWLVGSSWQFSSGLLLGGEVGFVFCVPVGSAKVRSFLQPVWFGGGAVCIAPSESFVLILSVQTTMTTTLVSAVFLVEGIVGELSHPATLSVLRRKPRSLFGSDNGGVIDVVNSLEAPSLEPLKPDWLYGVSVVALFAGL